MTTPFLAFDVALSLVRSVFRGALGAPLPVERSSTGAPPWQREPLALISRRDPKLADQLRRAAASVPLNVAEGNRRVGRDRQQSFRIAAGSAAEVEASLLVAEAFGYLPAAALQPAQALADREQRLLRGLTR